MACRASHTLPSHGMGCALEWLIWAQCVTLAPDGPRAPNRRGESWHFLVPFWIAGLAREVTVCTDSGRLSGRLPVAGYFSHLVLGWLPGDVDPAGVAVARDVHADERVEGSLVDAVITVAHDGPVDVA